MYLLSVNGYSKMSTIKSIMKAAVLLALVPALASAAASFSCYEPRGNATSLLCCRESREFGLASCEGGGPAPRKLLLTFRVPRTSARYGVLLPDADEQHRSTRVSIE